MVTWTTAGSAVLIRSRIPVDSNKGLLRFDEQLSLARDPKLVVGLLREALLSDLDEKNLEVRTHERRQVALVDRPFRRSGFSRCHSCAGNLAKVRNLRKVSLVGLF